MFRVGPRGLKNPFLAFKPGAAHDLAVIIDQP
jgi:hypothetical protein